MRAVVQRVSSAQVTVDGEVVGAIDRGLLVLVGLAVDDSDADATYIRDKVLGLRIFDDAEGRMNLDVAQVGGSLLLVSQFTLYGDARKGRRPGYSDAMPPAEAESAFARFVEGFQGCGVPMATGRFRAHMVVSLVNDGPVTLLLDSRKGF